MDLGPAITPIILPISFLWITVALWLRETCCFGRQQRWQAAGQVLVER